MSGIEELIKGAIEWGEAGVPCFPCGPNKAPLTENGFYDAETEPDKIRALFEFFPNAAMVGARMGKDAGLFAVDADLYKGDVPKEYIEDLMSKGYLPDTRIHRTLQGGLHMLYRSDTDWPNLAPVPGIEVKGEGGYIIVPPSPGYELIQEGVVSAPKALIKELQKAKDLASSASIDGLKLQVISGESYHDALRAIAARRSAQGWPVEKVMAELLAVLDTSVGKNPNHERHQRWSKLTENNAHELTRIVGSGHEKFNASAKVEKVRELGKSNWAEIAEKSAFLRIPPDGGGEIPEVQTYSSEVWPFEGEGYFATEEFDLLNQDFIAPPLLAEQEVSVVYAEPKKGKTAWSLTLAFYIACGRDFGDILVPKALPVLYFALEGPRAIKLRLAALRSYFKEQGWAVPDDLPLFIIEAPKNLYREAERVSLANQIVAADQFQKNQGKDGIGLIIFDTLTKAMSSGDQNSAQDTAEMFEVNGLIRDGGITGHIMYIHHKNKGDKGVRGSSNIEAEPDVLLDVTKDGPVITVRVDRARSIEEGGFYNYELESRSLGTTNQGIDLQSFVAKPVKVEAPSMHGTLNEAKKESAVLAAICTMPKGIHPVSEVAKVIRASGVSVGKAASTIDALLVAYISYKGRVFQGTALALNKSRSGTITGVSVGV